MNVTSTRTRLELGQAEVDGRGALRVVAAAGHDLSRGDHLARLDRSSRTSAPKRVWWPFASSTDTLRLRFFAVVRQRVAEDEVAALGAIAVGHAQVQPPSLS